MLLLAVTAGCTGGGDAPGEAASSPLASRSVDAERTLDAKPVPTRVTVARVYGDRLRKQQRGQLQRQVTRVVSSYFDGGFLAGPYPRTGFARAFAPFSKGAARRARADRDLLTNAASGAETEAVVPRVKAARLYVLARHHRVVGLTARINLVFVQERTKGADQRVRVSGRLLLQRRESGAWGIFGYDVSRSSVPASKGAGR